MGTHPIFESDFDCLTDMGGSFRSYVWDPPLILSQMVTLQCVYYGSLGLLLAITSFLFGLSPTLSYLFDPSILHLSNKENILLVICHTITAANGSIALWYFVKRAKQCLGMFSRNTVQRASKKDKNALVFANQERLAMIKGGYLQSM